MTALDEEEMKTMTVCHNPSMDTETQEVEISEADQYPFVKGITPGTMSGAEMLADWEENGCFDVWAEQYKDIGTGKKYAESTEYVQAVREQVVLRGR